jgi:UDP-N-acetylglucosamine 2-epimerase (non-hydrolysing)
LRYLVDLIVGARPNFMKMSSILNAVKYIDSQDLNFDVRLVHTGQHYDEKMSDIFFNQLGIRQPDINLNIGSGSQAEQVANIMIKYECLLESKKCDFCLVVGDVNSTMACAIVAKKMHIKVGHIEGGIRSFDQTMPEEINRMVTDSITDLFFTTSKFAGNNLLGAGISEKRIFFVGNTMIDTLIFNLPKIRPPSGFEDLNKKEFILLTMHRPNNVDSIERLKTLLNGLANAAPEVEIVFPVHPRTQKMLALINHLPDNVKLLGPQPYLEFVWLIKNSVVVVTDSGGITEEATFLKIPCITLRSHTERPETVEIGSNVLVGSSIKCLSKYTKLALMGEWKSSAVPEKWDGHAGRRIVDIINGQIDFL